MRVYYNTNGFAHHRLDDVVDILADLGYDGISLTPDVHHLDPYHATPADVDRFRDHVDARGLAVTIEAGARFVIDSRRKHQPTLLSNDGHERRADFYRRLIDLAPRVGSRLVSIWSGVADDRMGRDECFARLAERLRPVLDHAESRGVTIAFEPEPGMFVETVDGFRELQGHLDDDRLKLTIDTGHLAAVEAGPHDPIVRDCADVLVNVQADDAPRGVHEHRMFGEGDVDFPPLFAALDEIGYDGPVSVELSRHSHVAPAAAAQALAAVRGFISARSGR